MYVDIDSGLIDSSDWLQKKNLIIVNVTFRQTHIFTIWQTFLCYPCGAISIIRDLSGRFSSTVLNMLLVKYSADENCASSLSHWSFGTLVLIHFFDLILGIMIIGFNLTRRNAFGNKWIVKWNLCWINHLGEHIFTLTVIDKFFHGTKFPCDGARVWWVVACNHNAFGWIFFSSL